MTHTLNKGIYIMAKEIDLDFTTRKHVIKEIDVEGWGKAFRVELYLHDEDGRRLEFTYDPVFRQEEVDTLVDTWKSNPNLFYVLLSGVHVEKG